MNERAPSALKQPLVWLVIALPALSVIGGVSMLFLSDTPPDSIADPVKRTAQVQEADLSRDIEAQRRALSARLHRNGSAIDVVAGAAGFDRDAPLELVLRHPVLASEDRRLALAPTPAGWSTHIDALDATHDWNLELAPTDGRWRLVGRWKASAADADLHPALGPVQ